MTDTYEVNFDGIVGPTHNYSGLSYGNVASIKNKSLISNPKEAALQGLAKMKLLSDLGIKQAVLPPHERPYLPVLKNLGFTGRDDEILAKAWKEAPDILAASSSAAAMWAANSATVSPSVDSLDHHFHITPANLSSKFHRSIERAQTQKVLQLIFKDSLNFIVHRRLPASSQFADEGAANHTRFCRSYGELGVHLFVFGRYAFVDNALAPKNFPARQTFEACQALARLHCLDPKTVVFAQQNPDAIDAGAFHNDVVSVGNENVFLYHENAFVAPNTIIKDLRRKVEETCETPLNVIKVEEDQVSLKDAINTYLFNSQIVTLQDNTMALIAPTECQENDAVQRFISEVIQNTDNPISTVHYFNLRQSMQNGGGPACLRFRAVLTGRELNSVKKSVLFNDRLYERLKTWVNKYYRDRLQVHDLANIEFYKESQEALNELTKILELGPIYTFQKGSA